MIILIMMSVKPGNCRNLPKSEETANSSPCNNKMEDVCSSFEDSEDYSMQLKTDNFHTTGKIQGMDGVLIIQSYGICTHGYKSYS